MVLINIQIVRAPKKSIAKRNSNSHPYAFTNANDYFASKCPYGTLLL